MLEAAWKAETRPVRDLYRAVLQVGVTYYQIERGNYEGALKLFLRVRQWLDPLPERCQGIDVATLRIDAAAAHAHLDSLGAAGIAAFDKRLLKPVLFHDSEENHE